MFKTAYRDVFLGLGFALLLTTLQACGGSSVVSILKKAVENDETVRFFVADSPEGGADHKEYYLAVPHQDRMEYFHLQCAENNRILLFGKQLGFNAPIVADDPLDLEIQSAAHPDLSCDLFKQAAANLVFNFNDFNDSEKNGYYLRFAARPSNLYMIGCQAVASFLGVDYQKSFPSNNLIKSFTYRKQVIDLSCFAGERPGPLIWADASNQNGSKFLEVSRNEDIPAIDLGILNQPVQPALVKTPKDGCDWLRIESATLKGKVPSDFDASCSLEIRAVRGDGISAQPLTITFAPKKIIGTFTPYFFQDLYLKAGESLPAIEFHSPISASELKSLKVEVTGGSHAEVCGRIKAVQGEDSGTWRVVGDISNNAPDAVCDVTVRVQNSFDSISFLGSFHVYVASTESNYADAWKYIIQNKLKTMCLSDEFCYINVASDGQAQQSSVDSLEPSGPYAAIDDDPDNASRTNSEGGTSFWEISYPEPVAASFITLAGEKRSCVIDDLGALSCPDLIQGAAVEFYDDQSKLIARRQLEKSEDLHLISFAKALSFKTMRISRRDDFYGLRLQEVKIWKKGSPLVWKTSAKDLKKTLLQNEALSPLALELSGSARTPRFFLNTFVDPVCDEAKCRQTQAVCDLLEVKATGLNSGVLSSTKALPPGDCYFQISAENSLGQQSFFKSGRIRVLRTVELVAGSSAHPFPPTLWTPDFLANGFGFLQGDLAPRPMSFTLKFPVARLADPRTNSITGTQFGDTFFSPTLSGLESISSEEDLRPENLANLRRLGNDCKGYLSGLQIFMYDSRIFFKPALIDAILPLCNGENPPPLLGPVSADFPVARLVCPNFMSLGGISVDFDGLFSNAIRIVCVEQRDYLKLDRQYLAPGEAVQSRPFLKPSYINSIAESVFAKPSASNDPVSCAFPIYVSPANPSSSGELVLNGRVPAEAQESVCQWNLVAKDGNSQLYDLGLFEIAIVEKDSRQSRFLAQLMGKEKVICDAGSCFSKVTKFTEVALSSQPKGDSTQGKLIIDGDTDGSNEAHVGRSGKQTNPNLTLRLDEQTLLEAISIWNSTEQTCLDSKSAAPDAKTSCAYEFNDAILEFFDGNDRLVASRKVGNAPDLMVFSFKQPIALKYLRITLPGMRRTLRIAEIQLWKRP
jgi:hypothetical protein